MNALFHIQRTDTLWSIYFMTAEGYHIGIQLFGFHRNFHKALNAVAMSNHLGILFLYHGKSLFHRKYVAVFVVHKHTANKESVLVHSGKDITGVYLAVLVR